MFLGSNRFFLGVWQEDAEGGCLQGVASAMRQALAVVRCKTAEKL